MNTDERLEEMVARTTEFCGCDTNKDVALCVHDTEAAGELERRALGLARALLRARQDKGQIVSLMRSSLKFWPTTDHPKPCGEDMCWFCFLEGELEAAVEAAEAILDDPELEELLR